MGNKPRRTCSACGASFKDGGPAQERCPKCAAPCLRVAKPPPPPSRKAARRAASDAFLDALDARTVLVDAPGPGFAAAVAAVAAASSIAVDAEGVQLSRTGPLTVLQLATAESVYVFDIAALGAAAFDAPADGVGLRDVLADGSRTKAVWDARRDSDALHHQFGVALAGVLDVQLAAVAVRRAAGDSVATLPGLPQTVARFLDAGSALACAALKQHVGAERAPDFWARRPLSRPTLRYAAADARLTQLLAEALAPQLAADAALLPRVLRASDARVREWRDCAEAVPQLRTAAHAAAPDV